MPDLPLFETSAPERLIAGIGAGLTFWVRWEIVLVELEGSTYVPVVFWVYDMLSLSNFLPDFATFARLTLIPGITPFGVRNRLLPFLRRSTADTKC